MQCDLIPTFISTVFGYPQTSELLSAPANRGFFLPPWFLKFIFIWIRKIPNIKVYPSYYYRCYYRTSKAHTSNSARFLSHSKIFKKLRFIMVPWKIWHHWELLTKVYCCESIRQATLIQFLAGRVWISLKSQSLSCHQIPELIRPAERRGEKWRTSRKHLQKCHLSVPGLKQSSRHWV